MSYCFSLALGPMSAPNCPMCRTRINLILPYFSIQEREGATSESTRNDFVEKIKVFNRRFSGEEKGFSLNNVSIALTQKLLKTS